MVYVSITGFEDRAAYGNGDPAGKRDYKTIRLGQAAGPGTCAVSNGSPAPGPRRASNAQVQLCKRDETRDRADCPKRREGPNETAETRGLLRRSTGSCLVRVPM